LSFASSSEAKGPKTVAKKSQTSTKHSTSKKHGSLEESIMLCLGEAHSLGIPLTQGYLAMLNGYSMTTTTYKNAFKEINKKGRLIMTKMKGKSEATNVVNLSPGGIAHLNSLGKLPPTPPSNEDAAKRIKALLQKLKSPQIGYKILEVMASEPKTAFLKDVLAKKVEVSPTTNSFRDSLKLFVALKLLEKGKNDYEITNVFVPFPTK
jgi:hypothetical protein